eukprot:1527740-Alexandrium_andersonii.AAC.2
MLAAAPSARCAWGWQQVRASCSAVVAVHRQPQPQAQQRRQQRKQQGRLLPRTRGAQSSWRRLWVRN